MKSPMLKCAATLPLLFGFAGLAAAADQNKQCDVGTLNGLYVFTASGFTRPPASVPGTPWTPKAILELLNFNGDGTLTSPGVILANPFGDLGNILQPGAGANGVYSVNDDCSGLMHFGDANGVEWKFFVDPSGGGRLWMIQTNPANNVFQSVATRVSSGTGDCDGAGSELRQLLSPGCK